MKKIVKTGTVLLSVALWARATKNVKKPKSQMQCVSYVEIKIFAKQKTETFLVLVIYLILGFVIVYKISSKFEQTNKNEKKICAPKSRS